MGEGRLRRALHRLLRSGAETEPEQDPALVGLLTGSRYAGLPPEEAELSPDRARAVMVFILDLTEQMFIAGTEMRAIETSIVAVAASYGLHPLELTIVGRTVVIQYAPRDREPRVMLKVARTSDNRDLQRAVALYRLVDDVVNNHLDLSCAERRMREIRQHVPLWPWWARMAARAVLAASVALQAHGTLGGAGLAMGMLVIVNRTGWVIARGRIPGYYATFVQAALVAGLGIVALHYGVVSSQVYASATAANLVLLLPVSSLVSLAQDAITRFGTTAAVRLVHVVLVFLALFAGIATVGVLTKDARIVGNAQSVRFAALPILFALPAAAIGAAGNGLAAGGTLRLLPFAALMGMLGIAVRTLAHGHFDLPSSLAVLIAAIALGTVAGRLAPRLRLPPGALVTPAIGAALLPAPAVYRSLSAYTAGIPGTGRQLFSALITTAAIGAGIVLGNILGAKKELREPHEPDQNPQEE
ncbi:threonine/serine exporter family protein [Actinomadura verrucosospora]|uniref:Threonine/serine exporter-like N-terminal domain-containing protein n=1 Tax=Actinomadura verrucosospora TaxID=46165 RepID=A0A7D3VR87_ACTVE|nr:threonine/serine exporter family protein [Actinomadura verrucosospora]QKG18774.1 hypothetical protein ACTIVE_0410 [Actinomadura verrucosospora]